MKQLHEQLKKEFPDDPSKWIIIYNHSKTAPCRNFHQSYTECQNGYQCNFFHVQDYKGHTVPPHLANHIKVKNKK